MLRCNGASEVKGAHCVHEEHSEVRVKYFNEIEQSCYKSSVLKYVITCSAAVATQCDNCTSKLVFICLGNYHFSPMVIVTLYDVLLCILLYSFSLASAAHIVEAARSAPVCRKLYTTLNIPHKMHRRTSQTGRDFQTEQTAVHTPEKRVSVFTRPQCKCTILLNLTNVFSNRRI